METIAIGNPQGMTQNHKKKTRKLMDENAPAR
jgi:hypothetical protein